MYVEFMWKVIFFHEKARKLQSAKGAWRTNKLIKILHKLDFM